ncbi:MAG: acyltransferase family protein [Sedimenticola sp.]
MHRIDGDISQRIALLRYLMIFGIIVLHTPPYIPLAETGSGLFEFIKAIFQHAIFRASVPVLTFISGYLLFRAQLDLQFNKLLVKKTKTILIPLILFNVPIVLAVYLVQANQLIDHEFSKQLYPLNLTIWVNSIIGLFDAPINYPLNFLRDLYLLSLIAPLLGLFLRRYAWYGLILIFLLFWFNLDGSIILRNTMPIVFYMGGMAAVKEWDLRKLDRFAIPCLVLFLVFCIVVIEFQIENRNYLRLVSPILIWPAASLLVNAWLGNWLVRLSKYSFLTFLAHGPLLLVAMLIYQKLLPAGTPYWLFWVMAPVLTAALLAQIYIFASRFFPKTMSVLLGGR